MLSWPRQSAGDGEIFGVGQLHQHRIALDDDHLAAERFDHGRIVGRDLRRPAGVGVGAGDGLIAKGLGRLGQPQALTRRSLDACGRLSFQCVRDGQGGDCAVSAFKSVQQTPDEPFGNEGTGSIVDKNGIARRQSRQSRCDGSRASDPAICKMTTFQAGQRRFGQGAILWPDYDNDLVCAGLGKGFGGPAQNGLSTQVSPLFCGTSACALTGSCGDDDS